MARPNIVRADTLDLQDTENPTAAEHQKHPATSDGGLAPHQRAEVSHIAEERHSEELALSEAWNIAENNLDDEPGILEEQQQQHDVNGTSAPLNNGEEGGEGEAGEGEGEGEGGDSEMDGDDDLMDRISSSPSIDEGVYSTPTSSPPFSDGEHLPACSRSKAGEEIWPARKSSLSPSPSAQHGTNTSTTTFSNGTFNESPAVSTPDDTRSDSSPYTQTAQHLPLHVRRLRKGLSLRGNRPPSVERLSGSGGLPRQSSLLRQASTGLLLPTQPRESVCHHTGRYAPDLESLEELETRSAAVSKDEGFVGGKAGTELDWDGNFPLDGALESSSAHDYTLKSSTTPIDLKSDGHSPVDSQQQHQPVTRSLLGHLISHLEPSGSLSSITSVNLEEVLLPIDDPLLDIPPSPTSSSGSWEDLPPSGSESPEDDNLDDSNDGTDTLFTNLDDRFIDSGWGGECLQDTESIDFGFVYALHSFTATVDGQATATKGDNMELLDDSNSYWWLVRVMKDGNLGYLPAEHIETPSERLARLNKHRNIDLSQTMLSDGTEKNMNPLRKAMRRRHAKTVQFAAPTYVEASDYEYSSDEDQADGEQSLDDSSEAETAQQQTATEPAAAAEEEPAAAAAAEAKSPHESRTRSSSPRRRSFDREQAAMAAAALENDEQPQSSPKLVDKTEAAPLKSRKGTPRNTDSFLKDDSIETRKITLTPGLLREENSGNRNVSNGNFSAESLVSSEGLSQRNDSIDKDSLTLVNTVSPPDSQLQQQQEGQRQPNLLTKKDSKREKKEKKPGMLSGLFRSKNKKDKKAAKEDVGGTAEGGEAVEKLSMETGRESPRDSPIGGPSEPVFPTQAATAAIPLTAGDQPKRPEVQTRQPTGGPTATRNKRSGSLTIATTGDQQQKRPDTYAPERIAPLPLTGDGKFTSPTTDDFLDPETTDLQQRLNVQNAQQAASKEGSSPVSPLAPITNLLKRDDSKAKIAKVKRSKQRVELDDFDSPVEEEQEEVRDQGQAGKEEDDSLEESPVEIMPGSFTQEMQEAEAFPSSSNEEASEPQRGVNATAGAQDTSASSTGVLETAAVATAAAGAAAASSSFFSTSSAAEKSAHESEDSDPTPTGPRSPHLITNNNSNNDIDQQQEQPPISVSTQKNSSTTRNLSTSSASTSTSTTGTAAVATESPASSSQQSWSDASLRSWLDDGSEVKDMMVLIHDTTGVEPVGRDHPLMVGLFEKERRGIEGMMGELDGLLGGFLERKGISLA